MIPPLTIAEDNLTSPDTLELVHLHLRGMHANSPPENVFALGVDGLRAPGITVWTARIGGRLAGMGALKRLGPDHGEVKSMRTHPDFLRRGVASALLETIITEAQRRGLRRLSLETGRGPAFEPALALYRRRGFADGEAFADYPSSGFSQFLHLDLPASS